MRISDIIKRKKPVLSFEVFPPKANVQIDADAVLRDLAVLAPDFISVTNGAGGAGASEGTVEIAEKIKKKYGVESIAHLVCAGLTRGGVDRILKKAEECGIDNILALRGDGAAENAKPKYAAASTSNGFPSGRTAGNSSQDSFLDGGRVGNAEFKTTKSSPQNGFSGGADTRNSAQNGFLDDKTEDFVFKYARDLIEVIDKRKFCVGAAAYPEGHINAPDIDTDLDFLKQKTDAGADFLTTQLFFDNALFFRFRSLAEKKGIKEPILCGIMPILSESQISRMIFMCGASLPGDVVRILRKYGNNCEDLVKAGIDYAAKQINDLILNGADGIHIYTMNRPAVAAAIKEKISV
ncbi:MAG: methylenetetrahydrofolate reductase [Clostridiales bacterium]|jgi:5,10-methylenetetrahydrofolate reductase|nr:methylenetetrahydrofolate reductase [Clostridiales bacterium]